MHRVFSIHDTLCNIFNKLDQCDGAKLGQTSKQFFAASLPFVWQSIRLVDLMRTLAYVPPPAGLENIMSYFVR